MTGTDIGERVRNALRQVAAELESLLHSAREALGAFHGGAADAGALDRCCDDIRQAGNVLTFLELAGAARLAEEAGLLAADLRAARPTSGDGAAALARGLVGLSDYLDGLCAGEPDRPLKLLPLVNDVRAARGVPAVMGSALLGCQLRPEDLPVSLPAADVQAASPAEMAQRIRHEYQRGLLSVLRQPEMADTGLAAMAAAMERLMPTLRTAPVARLFWLVQGVLEALQAEGLPLSEPVRLVLGRVDQALKTLGGGGEEALLAPPFQELTRELMASVGQAVRGGEHTAAIQKHLMAEQWLPQVGDDFSGQARAALMAASRVTREELERVREALDDQARMQGLEAGELDHLTQALGRIRDSLTLLGLEPLQQAAADLVDRVTAARTESGEANVLDSVADGLLRLDMALAELEGGAASGTASDDDDGAAQEQQAAESALLRTALRDLGLVRERVEAELTNASGTGEVRAAAAQDLARIGESLRFAGFQRPGETLVALSRWLHASDAPLDDERLAETVVGVEFYLSAWLQNEVSEASLVAAEQAVEGLMKAPASVPAPDPGAMPREEAEPLPAAGVPETGDAEFVAVFLEEAEDVLKEIRQDLPLWQQEDREALVRVRRGFHTLKGSGRLVGADQVGELAWAVEDTLNRVLEGRLEDGPAVHGLAEEALALLPSMLQALQAAEPIPGDLQVFLQRAEVVRTGQMAPEEPPQVPDVHEADAPAAAEVPQAQATHSAAPEGSAGGARDTALRGVFQHEARIQLETLRHALSGPISSERLTTLSRALHTLRGGAGAARAAAVEELSGTMDRYVRALGGTLPAEGRTLLQEGLAVIEAALAAFERDEPPPVEGPALLQRIDEARAHLQRHSAAADPELLATFLDEAADVLEALESGLRQWRAAPGTETVADVQRSLHTLKGSARLVGLQQVGDLSHAMETALAAEIALNPPAELGDLLDHSLDRLAAQCDSVVQGEPAPDVDDLIAALEQAMHTVGGAPDMTAIDVADAPAQTAGDAFGMEVEAPPVMTDPTEAASDGGAAEVSDVPGFEVEDLEPGAPFSDDPAPSSLADSGASLPREPSHDVVDGDGVFQDQPTIEPDPGHESGPLAEPVSADTEVPAAPAAPAQQDARYENVRVGAQVLDNLVEMAGEIGIFRERLDQRMSSLRFNTEELDGAVSRLREQLRQLDMETESRILFRDERDDEGVGDGAATGQEDTRFDPLEMDRYSRVQELARRILESLEDLDSIRGISDALVRESETLLRQQGRVSQELQEGLLHTRMVPVQRYATRLRRLVRQAADETGKQVDLVLQGVEAEVDRRVLDQVMGPLEHLLRNAVVHGIEVPQIRQSRGKPEAGAITVSVTRDGLSVVLAVADDGAGLDTDAIRRAAQAQGLLGDGRMVSERELENLVFRPGFSTASDLSQLAGRGVGLDAVAETVRRLGGAVQVDSVPEQGTTFMLRVPIALAVNRAMMVTVAGEPYAIPLTHVETVVRVAAQEGTDLRTYRYAEQEYEVFDLSVLLQRPASDITGRSAGAYRPMVLVRAGNRRVALRVDAVAGSREVVVKPLGVQLSTVPGLTGATILADGRIAFLLDLPVLVEEAEHSAAVAEAVSEERLITALVVDDSITIRRVTQRLLERHRMVVLTARDGVEALALLQDRQPDIVLMDVEMPRMDGYELCQRLRSDARWANIPIIMITSRTGEKHQRQARALGVDAYLGKPFQEAVLLDTVRSLTGLNEQVREVADGQHD